MEELENKNFEEEFLNVLEEPESTLILGTSEGDTEACTSYWSGCTSYALCKRDEGCMVVCTCDGECYSNTCVCDNGVCYGDTCSCDTPRGACYNDSQPAGTTYYWWAGGTIEKRGYYFADQSDNYRVYSARTKFTSTISASSAAYSAICNTLTGISANVDRIKAYGVTKFYMSGTGTTIIGSTGTNVVIGYILCIASATTHISGNQYIKVYARSTSSQTQFNNQWTAITGTNTGMPTSTAIKIPEKTFTIDVYSGTHLVQGATVAITNLAALFPQFSTIDTKERLRTGTNGRICLCTSSTTSTTITGTVARKGLYGGTAKAFTATQGSIETVQLTGNTAATDSETVTVSKINEINPSGIPGFVHQQKYLNLTRQILLNASCSSTTFNNQDTNAYKDVVLRFNATKKIEPGLAYYYNDPVLGKRTNSTYTVTAKTLTTSLQAFASLSWDISGIMSLALPEVQNTNSTTTAIVMFWCQIGSDTNDYYLTELEIGPGLTNSKTFDISYSSLTGVIPGSSLVRTLTLKANLTTSVSGVKLIGGSYDYSNVGGGTHPVT